MFSIIFGMKENGRFGEVEEKLPTIIKLQNSVFISFTLSKKHF